MNEFNVDTRPMSVRQRELEDRMARDLDPKIIDTLQKSMRDDSLKWSVIPLLMKRDLWELFWGVYRDTIEQQAEKMLQMSEDAKEKKPSMFGGFQT